MRGRGWVVWALLLFGGCARGVDLDGRSVDPLAGGGVTALLFVATTCPLSNRSAPELRRLYDQWRGRGVAFYLVYPDDPAAAVRAHQAAYGLPLPALRDPRHRLARAMGVTVTPEAIVYRGRNRIYRGRIDDRVIDFARERPLPTTHELADALAAAVAGRAPAVSEAPAFGCALTDPP
jgi:peroxiredoxin